jgi:hypothetical protein
MNKFMWSKSEKIAAKRAFETAYCRECETIIAKLKEMSNSITYPKDPGGFTNI